MPGFLSQQQIDHYHEQGFLAPVDVMSEDEADGYLRQLQAAETEYGGDLNAENRNNPHLAFRFQVARDTPYRLMPQRARASCCRKNCGCQCVVPAWRMTLSS